MVAIHVCRHGVFDWWVHDRRECVSVWALQAVGKVKINGGYLCHEAEGVAGCYSNRRGGEDRESSQTRSEPWLIASKACELSGFFVFLAQVILVRALKTKGQSRKHSYSSLISWLRTRAWPPVRSFIFISKCAWRCEGERMELKLWSEGRAYPGGNMGRLFSQDDHNLAFSVV